jgi:hypothetical protein
MDFYDGRVISVKMCYSARVLADVQFLIITGALESHRSLTLFNF